MLVLDCVFAGQGLSLRSSVTRQGMQTSTASFHPPTTALERKPQDRQTRGIWRQNLLWHSEAAYLCLVGVHAGRGLWLFTVEQQLAFPIQFQWRLV